MSAAAYFIYRVGASLAVPLVLASMLPRESRTSPQPAVALRTTGSVLPVEQLPPEDKTIAMRMKIHRSKGKALLERHE